MAEDSAVDLPLDAVLAWLRGWQDRLCAALEEADGAARFQPERWQREDGGGGGGVSRLLEGGGVFEKAGVNYSHIWGEALPEAASAGRPGLAGAPFQAAGVSLVAHPQNPYVPACHANLRVFSAAPKGAASWWFGGGYDLTPCYGFAEDCRHWHTTARAACAPFGDSVYPRFKRWCDEYFQLPHRGGETRGVGGLFFDDLNEWGFERCLDFLKRVGDSFFKAYLPLVRRRRDTPYGERERVFQAHRRGRYAEFNLLWDRGTRFGLQAGGRAESILMSLPPSARWTRRPAAGADAPETRLETAFLGARDWLATATDGAQREHHG